jgi:hypothetical protein
MKGQMLKYPDGTLMKYAGQFLADVIFDFFLLLPDEPTCGNVVGAV